MVLLCLLVFFLPVSTVFVWFGTVPSWYSWCHVCTQRGRKDVSDHAVSHYQNLSSVLPSSPFTIYSLLCLGIAIFYDNTSQSLGNVTANQYWQLTFRKNIWHPCWRNVVLQLLDRKRPVWFIVFGDRHLLQDWAVTAMATDHFYSFSPSLFCLARVYSPTMQWQTNALCSSESWGNDGFTALIWNAPVWRSWVIIIPKFWCINQFYWGPHDMMF